MLFKYTYKLLNYLSIPKTIIIIFNKRANLILLLIILIIILFISI